jgi:hypothetical protein
MRHPEVVGFCELERNHAKTAKRNPDMQTPAQRGPCLVGYAQRVLGRLAGFLIRGGEVEGAHGSVAASEGGGVFSGGVSLNFV